MMTFEVIDEPISIDSFMTHALVAIGVLRCGCIPATPICLAINCPVHNSAQPGRTCLYPLCSKTCKRVSNRSLSLWSSSNCLGVPSAQSLPCWMNKILFISGMMVSIRWVITRRVVPWWHTFLMVSSSWWHALRSSALHGSSRTRTFGWCTRALAIINRRRWPSDNWPKGCSAKVSRFNSCRRDSHLASCWALGIWSRPGFVDPKNPFKISSFALICGENRVSKSLLAIPTEERSSKYWSLFDQTV